ncbi:MAG: T9SS type A sorting domain-containing protein [Ferruginibacter sp.]|nr:T9SS type A sorting domain-containing protein [Ferruginibacter sp.]
MTVNPSPQKPIITWYGNQLSITASSVTYQWLLNGNEIQGATSASYTPVAIGKYQVKVTSLANNCSATSDAYTLVVLGIDPTSAGSPYSANIFPNPAQNDIAIKFTEAPQVTVSVQLINNIGTVIKSVRTKNKITNVKINEIPSGVYYIKIIGGNYNQVKKVEVIK